MTRAPHALVALLLVALCLAVTRARGQEIGTYPLADFRADRIALKVATNKKLVRKGYRRKHFAHPARFFSEQGRHGVIRYWIAQKARAKALPPRVPPRIVRSFLCIHSHEGAWNANTGNGYYGGLQMDTDFMDTYGADMQRRYGGYAYLWKPRDQILVAYRAWKVRGFYPWPTAARRCGLI